MFRSQKWIVAQHYGVEYDAVRAVQIASYVWDMKHTVPQCQGLVSAGP